MFARMGRHNIISSALLTVLLACTAEAQAALGWTQVSSTGPSPRRYHAMVYDSARGVCVLFGGSTSCPDSGNNETWEWNGATWTQVATVGTVPSPRWVVAMAYDSARGVCVLFGGYRPGDDGETWEYDGATASWTLKSTAGPSPRRGHAMAYDAARDETVLFGGESDGGVFYNDTWVWDGLTWSQRSPTVTPLGRAQHCMAYDSDRQVVVMHGGAWWLGPGPFADTWEWDGSTWTRQTSSGIPAGAHQAMVYDSFRRATTMLFDSDAWVWTGISWFATPYGIGPSRHSAAAAFDTLRNEVVVHGGGYSGAPCLYGETWTLRVADGPASYTSFGAGCPGAGGLVPILAMEPGGEPRIGRNTLFRASNLTPGQLSVTFFLLDLSNSAPMVPVPLGAIGLPGCDLLVRLQDSLLGSTTSSSVVGGFAIPGAVSLIGFKFYVQGGVFYQANTQALTNALAGVVGY